ncbi:MAG TPA: response regulator [Vicinamibacterales bacterium]|nr:response regulator [Vicinamibacterales bacterium]
MGRPLRALLVEDSPADAELLMHELEAAGFDLTCERVETADAMREALGRGGWDIVLSDYSLPTFSGPDALRIKQTMGSDIPFIIVSGTIGEETAVSALKAGAQDFLVKGRLARLVPAIDRELRDAAERREKRQLEEQLNHAQKMEAIGQLAGSVAHDFNNVLTAILGFSELALGGMAPDAAERGDLLEIRNAGERAAGLTRQLLAFSRQQVLQPKVHDLNELVNAVLPMLRRLLFENIDVVLSLQPNAAKIKIDATQLEQILINLVVNARDAMPRGGRLTIGTRSDAAAGSVALIVADTGEGMDEATRARIFEPFFTTKGAGKGTGLGLATVQRIVKQCDGSIEVTSEPRNGTMFRVNLPVVAHSAAAHQESQALPSTWQGSETVLLAEDDPSVRLLARLSLRRCGYTVLEAGNAAEAVAIAEDYAKPIDLLLSDVIMPDSTGSAPLIDRLRRRRPDLRVLYMSGYTDDAIVHHGVLDEGTAFLQKPFTPHALTQKVRDVLEQVTQ